MMMTMLTQNPSLQTFIEKLLFTAAWPMKAGNMCDLSV